VRSNQTDRIKDAISVEKGAGLRTDANGKGHSLPRRFGLEYDSVPRIRIESADMDLGKILCHLRSERQRKKQSKENCATLPSGSQAAHSLLVPKVARPFVADRA
jgi:hypothetical protein